MKSVNFQERAESSPASQQRPLWRYYTKSQKHKSEREFLCSKIIFIHQQEKLRGLNVKCPQKLLVERTQHVTRSGGAGYWERDKGRRRGREEVPVPSQVRPQD